MKYVFILMLLVVGAAAGAWGAAIVVRWNDNMTQTARIVAAVQNPHVSILGHPTTRQIGWRGPLQLDLDDVFQACAKAGTAIEIDADPRRMDLNAT